MSLLHMDDGLRERIEEAVKQLARSRFDGVDIVAVEVVEDVDSDDDEIIRVKVVFRAPEQKLDSRRTSGFVRYLRPRLDELGAHAFPIMSFVSDRDYKGVAA